jgi:hypothetical protein
MRFISSVVSMVVTGIALAAMMTFGMAMVGITLVTFIIVTPFFLLEERRRRSAQSVMHRTH